MHEYITYVADRAASREVETTADFYGLGRLIVSGTLDYETARDDLTVAYKARNLATSTVKTYLSNAYLLAQMFDTFDDVERFADDECNGSRSLKRLADTVRKLGKSDDESGDESGESGESDAESDAEMVGPTTDADRAAAILAILGSMTDAAAIASVRDAADAMLRPALAV